MAARSSDSMGCGGGCATVLGALVVVSLVLYLLKALWVFLLVGAAASFVAALVYRKKGSGEPEKSPEPDPTYVQECPHCGGRAEVSVYEAYGTCPYCDSSFKAEREPLERPKAEEKKAADPFAVLIAVGIVLAIMGGIGYAVSQSSDGSESGSSSTSSASATVAVRIAFPQGGPSL